MRFWKRKKKPQREVDAIFEKMSKVAFPGGEQQITAEADKVASLLDNSVSQDYAKDLIIHAKGRAFLALQSINDSAEALQQCIDSVCARSQGRLDRAMAEKVAAFAYYRLAEQLLNPSSPSGGITWADMTKKEALEVSRVTAYRLARHAGRNYAVNQDQQIYDQDPVFFIIAAMRQFLNPNEEGEPTKIKTLHDAIELCLAVVRTLALTYYTEKHGNDTTPDTRDVNRLANQELVRTLELLRNREAVRHYSDFDPSEARAAHEMQVPFDVALTLSEIGLLKDHPSPTDTRRKLISDIASGLRDD